MRNEDVATAITPMDSREIIGLRLKGLFPEGCRKILFVNPPNVPKEDFDPEVAKNKRYPVYPPVGFGILSQALQDGGYSREDLSILDLTFLLQERF